MGELASDLAGALEQERPPDIEAARAAIYDKLLKAIEAGDGGEDLPPVTDAERATWSPEKRKLWDAICREEATASLLTGDP